MLFGGCTPRIGWTMLNLGASCSFLCDLLFLILVIFSFNYYLCLWYNPKSLYFNGMMSYKCPKDLQKCELSKHRKYQKFLSPFLSTRSFLLRGRFLSRRRGWIFLCAVCLCFCRPICVVDPWLSLPFDWLLPC